MKIAVLLHHTYTKRDLYGNVYHVVRITNPATAKSFAVRTPSLNNVKSILSTAFTKNEHKYTTEECTGSSRLSSLPEYVYMDECHYSKDWRKALNGIGYRKLAQVQA